MADDVTRDEFAHLEARVRVVEQEIDGEKLVTRHILDQTIWNWMFETETDKKTGVPIATDRLNGAGQEHLRYISRRLPAPDCQLFLQTAQDVPYIEGKPPEILVKERNDLNNRRTVAIERFLSTQVHCRGSVYQVAIHDFAPPGIPSGVIVGTQSPLPAIQGGYQKLENNFQGVLQVTGTPSTSVGR